MLPNGKPLNLDGYPPSFQVKYRCASVVTSHENKMLLTCLRSLHAADCVNAREHRHHKDMLAMQSQQALVLCDVATKVMVK